MTVWALMLALGGQPTMASETYPSQAACERAAAHWVARQSRRVTRGWRCMEAWRT